MFNSGLSVKRKSSYVSSPFMFREEDRIFQIESMLQEVMEWNSSLEIPIIISLKNNAIRRIIRCFFYASRRPVALGFAGETASGKSTIAYDIIDTLEAFAEEYKIFDLITRINTDDYYYDRSEMVKAAGSFAEFAKHYDLDVPEALELELMKKHIKSLLDGNEVYLPEYDMSGTAIRRDDVKLATPSKIIISEGLFTLTPKVVDAFDFKIYVHVSHEAQKERFYRRAEERGLGSSMDEVYNNAASKAKIHIHPTAESADIILSGEAERTAYKAFVNKVLEMVKEIQADKILMYS